MAKAQRFEDLIVWQEARLLRKEIYAASRIGPFARDFEMRGQIRAAALSALDNIAEGFERGTNKEFSQFLNIRDRALSVSRRCSKLITYLRNSDRRKNGNFRLASFPDDWTI
jgi:four helix bundle protein